MTREENLRWLNQEIRTWETECQSKHPIKEALYEARKALEQKSALDKIRAEVKALSPEPTAYDVVDGNPVKDAVWETIADVLQIIDKYREESEGKKCT